jgi:hypothetical protein
MVIFGRGAGIVAMVAIRLCLRGGADNWRNVPWALPMVRAGQPQNIEAAFLVSSALGLIVAAAGCWDFCRREVK